MESSLRKALQKKPMNEEDKKDCVRLWLLYLFSTVLFVSVFLYLVDILDKLGEIYWSDTQSVIFKYVELLQLSLGKDGTCRDSNAYLDGCTMVLMIWLFKNAKCTEEME